MKSPQNNGSAIVQDSWIIGWAKLDIMSSSGKLHNRVWLGIYRRTFRKGLKMRAQMRETTKK